MKYKKYNKLKRIMILMLVACMSVGTGFVQEANAAAVDKLTIKIGYFGWPTSDYVEKASFTASEMYKMGTVKCNYSYWDGGKRVAIDSSLGVPLTTILDAAGIDQSSIAQFDFWTADSGNGAFTSFTWRQLIGTKRYYFKNLAACFEEVESDDSDEDIVPTPTPTPRVTETPEAPDDSEESGDNPEESGDDSEESNVDSEESLGLRIEDDITSGLSIKQKNSETVKVKLNEAKAWKYAKKVTPMMALEENWTWYEIGTEDATGTDNLGTSNRFRLNFGQASPSEKRTFNSAKQVHTIYIMFSGMPKYSADSTNIKGKVGSTHKVKITAATVDEALEAQALKNISWSSSDSSIVSVDSDGNLTFKKDGTATVTATVGGQTVEINVTVGDGEDGSGTGDGDGKGGGKTPENTDEKSGKNKSKTEKIIEKVEVNSNSYVLSDAASKRLKSALAVQTSGDNADMSTHQASMDEDSSQLVVQEKNMKSMNLVIAFINIAIGIGGVAFGLMRYRKQRWGKIWKQV